MPGKTKTPRAGDAAPERRGVYLLTVPRSASNLFTTMMAKQPGYQNSEYKLSGNPLITLSQLEKGRLSERPEDERKALYDEFRTRFGDLQDEVDDAHRNVSSVKHIFYGLEEEVEEKKRQNMGCSCF
jgi:hypothetical protein